MWGVVLFYYNFYKKEYGDEGMKLKKVLSIILSLAMIVSVAPVESFADDLDVAVEEFADETDEPIVIENEDETLSDESVEVEIQDEDDQQDVDYDEENVADAFSDGREISVNVGDDSREITASGEASESITWTLYADGELVIEGSGEIPDYLIKDAGTGKSTAPWNVYKEKIKSINLEGIERIGNCAFFGCNAMTVNMTDSVKDIGEDVFSRCFSLNSIHLSENITNIGAHAFERCRDLKAIKIPKGIESISGALFYDCESLTNIEVPDGVINIEGMGFAECKSLTSVELPESLLKIGADAFENCSKLRSIKIPKGVTNIGQAAFEYCSNLENVELPEKLVDIENLAFAYCTSLGNIKIPESVEFLRQLAFTGCNNLMEIEIPEGIKKIEYGAFWGCKNISYCIFGGTKLSWEKIKDDTGLENVKVYYKKEIHEHDYKETILKNATCTETGEKELICDICGDSKNENIPATGHTWDEGKVTKEATCEVAGVKTYTCTSCKATKTEDIKALGHKEVKDAAVAATCEKDGLTEGSHCSVCGKVFEEQKIIEATGHTEVKDAAVAPTCTTDGKTEGSHCSACGKILTEQQIIPAIGHLWSETYTIDKEATRTEPGQESIHCSVCSVIKKGSEKEIPATVQIFVKNQKLTNKISWTLDSDGELLINGTGSMPDYTDEKLAPWSKYDVKKVTISEGINQIGAYSFYKCNSLKEIELPQSIKAIGEGAFAECTSIIEMSIPKNVTSIESDLFNGCSNLKSVSIPNGVTGIGWEAFADCTSLTNIILPESVDGIDECAFYGCSSLKNITIPKKVPVIQNGAFYGCSSLAEVVISDGVEEIADNAFEDCISLKKITIPQSVTYIGEDVFKGCNSLKTINYTGKKSEWDKIEIDDSLTKGIEPECSQHDHKYVESIFVNPTCVQVGEKKLVCSICGDSYNEEIPATGHKIVIDTEEKATCEKTGKTEGRHCSVCGEILEVQRIVPAVGHNYSSWSRVSEATVFAPENQERSCAVCGHKENRTIGGKLRPTINVTANKIQLKTKQKLKTFKVTGLAKGDSIVSWKSNKTKVVKVSGKSNGTCTITAGKKTGKAVITVTLKSGLRKNITVTVQKGAVKTTKIIGVARSITLIKGQRYTLKPVRNPFTSVEKITYKSSNSKVATVNSKGVIKSKKVGKTVISVKAGKKTVKCTVVVKKLKYGTVQGNVTYHYNRYRGYVADTGSRVFLVPMDGRAKNYINSNHIYFAGLMNEEVLRRNNIYCAKVDGAGNYKIDRVPEGRYLGIIISNNSTSGEWFEAPNQDVYYQSIAKSFTSYLNARTAKSLGESVAFYRYSLQIVNVYGNNSVLFSEAFPYTYI